MICPRCQLFLVPVFCFFCRARLEAGVPNGGRNDDCRQRERLVERYQSFSCPGGSALLRHQDGPLFREGHSQLRVGEVAGCQARITIAQASSPPLCRGPSVGVGFWLRLGWVGFGFWAGFCYAALRCMCTPCHLEGMLCSWLWAPAS